MTDNKYPVKSVVKSLVILEHLGSAEGGSTLSEISASLRMGKSTVHRLLATLRDYDYVWLDTHSSRYVLGAKVLQLGERVGPQSVLIRYGDSTLDRLAEETNETCNLGVLDGSEVLYLVIKESKNPLRMTGHAGKRLPAHCTALGKALLSRHSREEIKAIYGRTQRLEAPTLNSISTVADLLDYVDEARQDNVFMDNEEIYPGVICLAAPVWNHRNRVVAAISISLPKERMDQKMMPRFRALLTKAAKELSRELGGKELGVKGAKA
jgi:DNA-binding IclR family transcriptional regulator